MPRVAILKASTAARRAIPQERYFDLSKQPTGIERVAARIFELIMNCGQEAAIINVHEDIVEPIKDRAPIFKDRNGPRIEQTILLALARLAANNYIEYCPHRDNVERFRITRDFQTIIQELIEKLTAVCGDTHYYNAIEHHRFNCCFFRTKFRRNFRRTPTRQELDLENRRLIYQANEHARVCPMAQTRAVSVATEATEIFDQEPNPPQNIAGPSSGSKNHCEDGDSMYVDDVERVGPVASGSGLQLPRTPMRPSLTLNSVGAYPSPESLERTNSVAPLTPEQTPTRSRSVTTTGADGDGLGDVEMDLNALGDDPPRSSNNLFNRDVSEGPRIEVIRLEYEDRLRSKDVECDARLAAQAASYEEQIVTKVNERDWWWSRKLNSVRKMFHWRLQFDSREADRRLEHRKARSQRKEESLLEENRMVRQEKEQIQEAHDRLKQQNDDTLRAQDEFKLQSDAFWTNVMSRRTQAFPAPPTLPS